MIRIFRLVFFLALSSNVSAEITLEQYERLSKDAEARDIIENYIVGVARGLLWASAAMEIEGGTPLFCMPYKLALGRGLALDLLSQEIKNPSKGTEYDKEELIELILTSAFTNTFPCNTKN
jgi:hypothetical protein